MKRLFAVLSILGILTFFGVPVVSSAASPFDDVCDSGNSTTGTSNPSSVCEQNQIDSNRTADEVNPLTGKNGIIVRAARIISFVVGVASVIMVIVGAIKYITSDGDSNSINSAKNTILYALIGLVITLLAQGIILFVVNAFN
jgi:ABC-type sugar transport system permease subunit